MTPAQAKYVELEKKKALYKQFLEELGEATKQVAAEIGVGSFFQDGEGTVYRVSIPQGKFVYFEQFTIDRTRREGEKTGTLSLKDAKEAGYDIK